MKDWNIQVKDSPKRISEKLESTLGNTKRFVFKLNKDGMDQVRFRIRKRLLLPFEINSQNNLIVDGKISKVDPGNQTEVEISFRPHALSKLLMYGHIVLGLGFLCLIILEYSNDWSMYLIGGLLIVIGVLLGIHSKRDFDKNVRDYKNLISGILK